MLLPYKLQCPLCNTETGIRLECVVSFIVNSDTGEILYEKLWPDFDHDHCRCPKCEYQGFLKEFTIKE